MNYECGLMSTKFLITFLAVNQMRVSSANRLNGRHTFEIQNTAKKNINYLLTQRFKRLDPLLSLRFDT